jgi:hypothetical protein
VTRDLTSAFMASLTRTPPRFPAGVTTITIPLADRIASQMAAVGNPRHRNRMNFNAIREVPGNIAGDIATDQTACPVGATPSPINDSRSVSGSAEVTRTRTGSLSVEFHIDFVVEDTVDLCPGNCGASMEQIATVPLSRWEASGISGDVPFRVEFPAPPTTLTTRARLVPPAPATPPAPPTAPTPASPPDAGATGTESDAGTTAPDAGGAAPATPAAPDGGP